MVEARYLGLVGLVELRPSRLEDRRGFFSEVWSERSLAGAGIETIFVQDNHVRSNQAGVLRGLHYQLPPRAQDKLVRVSRGAIFDVAVDLRRDSETFGAWDGLVLSSDAWNQLLIPKGFAHGYLTLTSEAEVQYKVSAPYDPKLDRSLRFDDPAIGINWPITERLMLSQRDQTAPLLAQADLPIRWR